ncbi:MAG TPA: selenocysteine-specific translation elongation factor [Vicinamibacterales bacterium]|jgi:selenocysteine-specific elongation factor
MDDGTHYIVATAGHVDHGKSALIKALTGTDPDRLPEEKARGITIDLGFAHLELPSPSSGSPIHVGIVDVPGHEDFVKNMVAGVGAIDLALLIVAADDGWMPQTEEHLQILSYFGVRRAVVSLTKADLVTGEAAAVSEVRRHLEGSVFADAPIVPTSVVTGLGLDALRMAIARELSNAPPPRDVGKPRLAVDRVFTLAGAGTIVTGTLAGGRLQRGQAVVIQPSGRPARIRRMQSHGRDVETSGPGTRTALNLADVDPVAGVHRGDVVTLPGMSGPSDCLDAMVEISARASRPLKDGVRMRVHHGSGNVPANLALGVGKELAVGQRQVAQLRLEVPVFLFAGDHLTLRDWSEQHTLGGAIVLDPDATRRAFRNEARQQWLERLAASIDTPADFVAAYVVRDRAVRRSRAFVKTRFSTPDIDRAIEQLVREGTVIAAGDMLVAAASWAAVCRRAAQLIDEGHREHPERQGLSLTDLRNTITKEFPVDELFDSLITSLSQEGFTRSGSLIQRVGHRAQLPDPLRGAGETLRRKLAVQPLEPPSRKDLTPDAASQRALKFLIDSGEVVEISAELVLSAVAAAQATTQVKAFVAQHGPATVSEIRQVLGSSRRIVVPLLEYLDRTFVTVRHGDKRALR